MNVLVINAGSSSLKYQLLNVDTREVYAKGNCERIGIDGSFIGHEENGSGKQKLEVALPDHKTAIKHVFEILKAVDAPIEQLEVWGERAGVDVITRERGCDPASVCYDVIEEAERRDSDLVLIDTAGRLHTSADLMQELAKVVNVTRKRAKMPVSVVLVIDATTGQNGLNQAKEFNDALDLDGLIITKLDGTAKGGIALAVSSQLGLPIYRIGVGESIDDLQSFDAHDFCAALVGEGM